MQTEPGAVSHQWVYAGPGWQEWLLAFAMTLLGASTLQSLGAMDVAQSAERYYSATPGVVALQHAGLTVNVLVVLATLAWIAIHKNRVFLSSVIMGLAVSGILLIAAELVLAARTQAPGSFQLSELPYRPVHAMGIVGIQVYAAFLLFKAPDGKLSLPVSLAIKAGFSLALWFGLLLVWAVVGPK